MPDQPPATELRSEAELQRRRVQIRHGLGRANTAAAIILLIVIGLALAAVWQAWRANEKALEVQRTDRRLQAQLYDWHIAQAHAERAAGAEGRRARSHDAVLAAAAIQPSLDLRNEAIANLALFDVRLAYSNSLVSPGASSAFDPNLQRVAFGDERGRVRIQRLLDNAVEKVLEGPPFPVKHLLFSPDGRFLSASYAEGERRIWDIDRAAAVATTHGERGDFFDTVAFAPDSPYAALNERTTSTNFVHLYQLTNGVELPPLAFHFQVRHIGFQPGGSLVALATNATVLLWDRLKREEVSILPHTNLVTRLTWHPDGRRLLTATRNGELRFWDTQSSPARAHLWRGHAGEIVELHFNHSGSLAVSGSLDGSCRFWEVESGRTLLVVRDMMPSSFSLDDKRLGFRRQQVELGIWEILDSPVYRTALLPTPPARSGACLELDPAGRFAVVCGSQDLITLPVESPMTPRVLLDGLRAHSAAFSADGSSLFTAGPGGLQRWPATCASDSKAPQLGTPELVGKVDGSLAGELNITRGTRDWLAMSGPDGFVVMDLAKTNTPNTIRDLPRAMDSAVSSDGLWLARSGPRQPTAIIRLEGDRQERHIHGLGGRVKFSPNGKWFTMGNGSGVTTWNVGAWDTPVWSVKCTTTGEFASQIAYFADSSMLAVNQSFGIIQFLDPTTGRQIASLTSPNPQNIQAISVSHNGNWLAALTDRREVQVWDLRRLRTELEALKLDWKGSQPASFASSSLSAGTSAPASAFGWPVWLPLSGALIALVFGVYVSHYQRQLVDSYDQIEQLAAQRHRQLEQTQAELIHSQKMKALGTLAAGIAHDFNNLLSVIRLANDFLRRGVGKDPELAEENQTIESAVEQGKRIVQSMLGYSRSNTGEAQLLNVSELVEDTLGLLTQQFLSGTRLTVDLDQNAPRVLLARGCLEQILLNLIVNASDAMKGGGHLAITVRTISLDPQAALILAPRPAPSYVELAVADSGHGIAPEIRSRIFEPFFTTKTLGAQPGTGLGLSMVYTAAQTDGLGIALDSTPGHGATFRILIPSASKTLP